MTRTGGLSYVIAAAAMALLLAQDAENALLWFYDYSGSSSRFALGLAGWAVATFGPLLLSLCCWLLVNRVQAPWLLHLLFLPCAVAIALAGRSLLLLAAAPHDRAEPLEYALLLAMVLLLLAILLHAGALIAAAASRLRGRATVG